jgi:hypothetical protein
MAEFQRLVPAAAWQRAAGPAEAWWTVSSAGDGSLALADLGGQVTPVWGPDRATEAARLARSAMELWAAEHAVGPVIVHAGVVAVKGRALLLPGRSRSGKTSLTAALVRAGAAYYSDEFAVLDQEGRIRPYPRPLAVRQRTASGETTHHLEAKDLGAVAASVPAAVGVIVDCVYDPTVEGVQLSATTEPRAALALMANAVAARSQPERVLDACTAAAVGTRSFAGRRGDTAVAAAALLEMLG